MGKPRPPESALALTIMRSWEPSPDTPTLHKHKANGERAPLMWLGVLFSPGSLLFSVLCFCGCCRPFSNEARTRQEEAWAVGRRYLETKSSTNPSPQLAGHSDFTPAEAGMEWGADLGQEPPTEEPVRLPTQKRLAWEPAASRGSRGISA